MTESSGGPTSFGPAAQRHKVRIHALTGRRLLVSVAAIALFAGSLATYAARPEVGGAGVDPFAAANDNYHKAAQASVSMPDFVPIVAAVKPAVVSVRVKSRSMVEVPQGNPFEGTPFERFFRPFGEPDGGFGNDQKPQLTRAQGSGFFISPDGYIVTNNHVVDHAVDVQIVMDDGTQLDAKVVGTDKRTDIALLKVAGHTDLPFVRLATGSPKIGSWVVAMGNPFGLGGTVTSGIVSAKGRDIGNGPYDDYIQIDAPVNRGNSGGPTFDMKGEVIGINTAIFSPSGGSVGIAFDIPADTVKSVVTQLGERGHVERGWLGVQVQPMTQAVADSLGLKSASGALISEPQPNGPAAKAGVKSGDVVEAINGKEIKDARALARTIAGFAPGTSVTLSVLRNGTPQQIKATLGEFKDQSSPMAEATESNDFANKVGMLGLRVAPASSVEGAGNEGVAVLGVDPSGAAADAGISAGDVILKAGDANVSSVRDLQQALANAESSGKKHTLALVRHNNTEHYVALPVPVG